MVSYLAQHPAIFLSPVKEPNHFSSASLRAQGLYYDPFVVEDESDYLALFADAARYPVRGEASVSYLFYEEACRRIAAFAPHARILVMLRDPVERAFSHYRMDRRLGLVQATFAEVLETAGADGPLALHYQQYVTLGLYADAVERYRRAFSPEQVCIVWFRGFRRDPIAATRRVFRHLDVDPDFLPDVTRARNVGRIPRNRIVAALYRWPGVRVGVKRVLSPAGAAWVKDALLPAGEDSAPDPAIRRRLRDLFEPDVRRLEEILGEPRERWRHD